MFDFQSTLDTAESYASNKNYALAIFHYWLINYAYENEEFPYYYTDKMGERARKGFLKYIKKYRSRILSDASYLKFKEVMACSTYNHYFANFERVIQYFIDRQSISNT